MWFSLGREDGFPIHYPDQHSPAQIDIVLTGVCCITVILLVSFAVILPAYTSHKRFIFVFLYTTSSLAIGGAIFRGNFGHHWETGQIELRSPYKPASPEEISGTLELHIALRGINITLKAVPETYAVDLKNEVINYNEHFSWEWTEGRFGFGPYSGQFSRDFRAATVRGLPIPILQLAEYFTFDGEGIRFGRHYRLAGWYIHFIMWCASASWMISNILNFMVIKYGGFFLSVTGILQISAVLIWSYVRNSVELSVPFESEDGLHEVLLTTDFGFDFYLVLFNGVFCTGLGLLIYGTACHCPEWLCEIFGINPLSAFDEVVLSIEEVEELCANPAICGNGHLELVQGIPLRSVVRRDRKEQTDITVRRRKSRGKSYFSRQVHVQPQPTTAGNGAICSV